MRLLKRSLLLLGILLALAAAPFSIGAQGELQIVDPIDVTGYIKDGAGVAGATIYINNETGRAGDTGITGILTVKMLLEAFSPSDAGENPLCVSVNGSECASEVATEITLPSEAVYTVNVTIETVDGTSLQFADATLITIFEEDTSRTTEPLLISDYRKVTFVPALYVTEVIRDTGILTVFFLLVAFICYLVRNGNSIFKNGVLNGFTRPLGEWSWGAQSWTAFVGSLVSTVGVFAISDSSAGISLDTFNAGAYTTTITTLGILFAILPLAAVILYRLCGRLTKSAPKGGNLGGYIIGSAFVVFALIGSLLISGNVIRLLIYSSIGVAEPAALSNYLSGMAAARLIILGVILAYFVANFRGDLTTQMKALELTEIKEKQEGALLDKLETAWWVDHEAATAALVALQTLPAYDLPIEKTTLRSMSKAATTSTATKFKAASAAPKMSI